MSNPVDTFVIALARASKRGSYHLRGLRSDERDDVLATALAWCWENRAKYDPTLTLEQWFDAALCESRSKWLGRGKRKKVDAVVTAVEFNERMAEVLPDPTADSAQAHSAAEALLAELDPKDRIQVYLIARGMYEPSPELKARLRKLKHLLPDQAERIKVMRKVATRESDSIRQGPAPKIDQELAALSQPSKSGADCPVCWRCMYFEGFKPRHYAQRTTTPADPEIQAAIWATEQRKIDIATRGHV